MIDVAEVNRLHRETVQRWHRQPVDNTYDGVMAIICKQHSFNFLLWHEEDIARSHDVTDERIASVKRAIDGYNQQRNDWIEKIDDWLTATLTEMRVAPLEGATMNSETPGSVIDRLSILSLRIYHLVEQLERTDVDQSHIDSVQRKIAVCLVQQEDLSLALMQLLSDIRSGVKRHKTYRQLKMYNDPLLNPEIYDADRESDQGEL